MLADGTIEGFVGGVCAEHSVRAYSLQALADRRGRCCCGSCRSRRATTASRPRRRQRDRPSGAVTVQNPCLSGGAIEVFLEPVLPAPRVLVAGDTPIARRVRRLGAELGLRRSSQSTAASPSRGRATSRWSSRRTAATSCTRSRRASRRASPTSAWWPAASAAPACSPSCAATACPRSCSAGSTCPPGIDIGARTPGRDRALDPGHDRRRAPRQGAARRPHRRQARRRRDAARRWPSTRSAA